jgi:hypothetical protein
VEIIAVHPLPYGVWAATVVTALYATYFVDPYVFGLTTLGLAWLTGAVTLVGLIASLFSKRPRLRDRVIIVVALVIATAAIAKALITLSRFNWA